MDETPEIEAPAEEAEQAAETAPADAGWAPVEPEPARPPIGRLVLGLVAEVVIAAVAVALWCVLTKHFPKRNFIGLTVVAGLAGGYALREISRRSSVVVRLASALVVAISCVFGVVAYEATVLTNQQPMSFSRAFDRIKGDWWTLLRHQNVQQLAILAVAVIIAFLAAGPAKPKKVKATEVPTEDEEPAGDEPAGEEPVEPVEES